MAKRIKKIESGSNMDGANMEGTKPNIKRVRLNSVNDSPNAPEYPPRPSMGIKRLDWGKKGNTPTGKGGSGSANPVGNFGAAIEKEDGGGDGGGAFGDGGGTVFTSTNAGIFTPTHGRNGNTQRVKSNKKSSGIERLGVFLTDGSPEKKMKKTKVLKEWVTKQKEEELPQFVEEAGEEDTSNRVLAEQQEMENKIKMLNDEEKNKDDDNFPTTDNVSAHITDVQLSKQPMAFGNPQDDELKRGAKKDKQQEESMELSEKEVEDILKYMGIVKYEPAQKDEPILDLMKSTDTTAIAKRLMRL